MGDADPADGDEPDDRNGGDEADEPDAERRIYHREIDPDPTDADYNLLELIADVEGVDVTDLPPLYDRIDHFVTKIYENPPSGEAQVELSFSYAGYRITLDQNGNVSLMRVGDGHPSAP